MINPLQAKVAAAAASWTRLQLGTGAMESNARYYSRRAVEERMKAQRAITEPARAWHAKLAHDFAERASACTSDAPAALSA